MEILEAIKILKLPFEFTNEDIKRNYHKLCLENHPDKYSKYSRKVIIKQTKLMSIINSAYSILRKKSVLPVSVHNLKIRVV